MYHNPELGNVILKKTFTNKTETFMPPYITNNFNILVIAMGVFRKIENPLCPPPQPPLPFSSTPDLNTCNYFLLGYIKDYAFLSYMLIYLTELQVRINHEFVSFEHEMFNANQLPF